MRMNLVGGERLFISGVLQVPKIANIILGLSNMGQHYCRVGSIFVVVEENGRAATDIVLQPVNQNIKCVLLVNARMNAPCGE